MSKQGVPVRMGKVVGSARDDTHQGGMAPGEAHMAHGQVDNLCPIPKGSHLFFIEDPRRADTILEVIVEKIEYDNHHFKGLRCWAYSKDMKSPRRLYLTAAWVGEYKSKLDTDNAKVETQMNQLEAHREPNP